MNKGEKYMPQEGAEGALGVIRNPERSIGSAIESIKSSQKRNLFEASSLFVAKEALDVKGYEQEGGGFNEDLLKARAGQTVLPDGSRPAVEMVRDWFEAKKELTEAILDGKVDVGRPITQQNKEEAAYYKGLNITRQREGAGATEPHITDPDENRKIFEEAAGELESEKARDLSFVVENWEDLVSERARQLSEVREGKQTQTQDLNEFLKERLRPQQEEVAPKPEEQPKEEEGGGEAQTPAGPTEGEEVKPGEVLPTEPAETEEARENRLRREAEEDLGGLEETKPREGEGKEGEQKKEGGEEEKAEEKREEEKPEEKKEEKKATFLGKVGGFINNWWKSVSPQGRNKMWWGFGVAVGAAETIFVRSSLTTVLGPAGSWAVSGLNALALNGLNYRVQKGITEARANQDLEKLQKLESQYKKTADFFAGIAAGSVGTAIGDGLFNNLVAPRLPGGAGPWTPSEFGEGLQSAKDRLAERFGLGGEGGGVGLPGEVQAAAPTPEDIGRAPFETPQPVTTASTAEAVMPVETMRYVVKPGDTITDILFNSGHSLQDTYGKSLTDFITMNADVLKERALDDAQRAAIDQVLANPDWLATDDNGKWKVIMRAGHWIFPGQAFDIPLPKAA